MFGGAGDSAAQPADVLAAARSAEIVVLGEIHDNPEHHRTQAGIVAALQPTALVFEMIPQEFEDEVNRLRAEGASREAIAEALDWDNSGWPEFDMYAPIMEAAPEARIFGAAQPLAEVRRAMLEGAAGVFGPDAEKYGLDMPLEPETQAEREALMREAHCGGVPAEMLPGLVEAQRFRDAGLADAALWARTMAGRGPVVVIAGTGHADKRRGMPSLVAIAEPKVKVFALAQVEAEPDATESAAFDAVIVAAPPDRDDPCEGFGAFGR
jgi:uncharacterized iron-regulated protein